MKKDKDPPKEKALLGRPGNTLKMGIMYLLSSSMKDID